MASPRQILQIEATEAQLKTPSLVELGLQPGQHGWGSDSLRSVWRPTGGSDYYADLRVNASTSYGKGYVPFVKDGTTSEISFDSKLAYDTDTEVMTLGADVDFVHDDVTYDGSSAEYAVSTSSKNYVIDVSGNDYRLDSADGRMIEFDTSAGVLTLGGGEGGSAFIDVDIKSGSDGDVSIYGDVSAVSTEILRIAGGLTSGAVTVFGDFKIGTDVTFSEDGAGEFDIDVSGGRDLVVTVGATESISMYSDTSNNGITIYDDNVNIAGASFKIESAGGFDYRISASNRVLRLNSETGEAIAFSHFDTTVAKVNFSDFTIVTGNSFKMASDFEISESGADHLIELASGDLTIEASSGGLSLLATDDIFMSIGDSDKVEMNQNNNVFFRGEHATGTPGSISVKIGDPDSVFDVSDVELHATSGGIVSMHVDGTKNVEFTAEGLKVTGSSATIQCYSGNTAPFSAGTAEFWLDLNESANGTLKMSNGGTWYDVAALT